MHPTEISREQRLFLVNLNNRLSETEKKLKKEALEIIDTLNKRANDDADWIHDFDLECTLEFYMREDDPDYSREKVGIPLKPPVDYEGSRHPVPMQSARVFRLIPPPLVGA